VRERRALARRRDRHESNTELDLDVARADFGGLCWASFTALRGPNTNHARDPAMIKQLFLFAATLLFAAPTALADKLKVGDPAPKIEVSKWVKGAPVPSFEKGRVYVIEFWATWCGPCRVSIPHLTELAKQNPKVTFVGVSISEHDTSAVEPFVEKMGDKMDYHVAMDLVTGEGKTAKGKMAETWMTAAGQSGIPTAFVVNGDGRIAWIGHPMALEKPLAKIVAGTWDIDAQIKIATAEEKLARALKAEDAKGALAAIETVVALDAALESQYATTKFEVLLHDKQYAEAYAYGAKLVDGLFKDDADSLNQLAWSVVDPEATDVEKHDLAFALKAASRANELTSGKSPGILDTLAKVHFDMGDVAKAIDIQQKAVDATQDAQMKKDLTERLEQYKKAAGKSKG
jgi:thiol-disulfide isomerase/thioredoxin